MRKLAAMILAVFALSGCHSRDQAGDALSQARAYAQAGQYEAALRKHLWFHEHALQVDRSYYGVRLSFALDDWVELGKKYPKALDALRQIRDQKASRLAGGEAQLELFHDVEAINQHLGDLNSTVAVFKQIDARDPAFAESLYEVAEKSLIGTREYALARKHLGDPQERFQAAKLAYKRGLAYVPENAEHRKLAQEATRENFTQRVVRLVRVLNQTGEQAQAREIQAEALQLCDSEGMKKALEQSGDFAQ